MNCIEGKNHVYEGVDGSRNFNIVCIHCGLLKSTIEGKPMQTDIKPMQKEPTTNPEEISSKLVDTELEEEKE